MPQNPQNPQAGPSNPPENPLQYLHELAEKQAVNDVSIEHATFTFRPKSFGEVHERLNGAKAEHWERERTNLIEKHPQFAYLKDVPINTIYTGSLPSTIVSFLTKKNSPTSSNFIDETRVKEIAESINSGNEDATLVYDDLSPDYKEAVFPLVTATHQAQIFNNGSSLEKDAILEHYKEYQPVRTDVIIADEALPTLDREDLYNGQLEFKLLAMGYTPETYTRIADEIKHRYYDEEKNQWTDKQHQEAYENAMQGYKDARDYLQDPQNNSSAQDTINRHHANPKLITFSENGLPTPLAAAQIAYLATNKDLNQDHSLSHYMTDNAPNLQSAKRLWSQSWYSLRNLTSRNQIESTVNQSGKLIIGSKNAISRVRSAISGIKSISSKVNQTVTQAPKKIASNLVKKGLSKIAVKLGLGGILGGIATGGVSTALVVGSEILSVLRRYWKQTISAISLGIFKILNWMNPASWFGNMFGGTTNAIGTSAHAITTGTGVIRTPVYNPMTGEITAIRETHLAIEPNLSSSIINTSTPFLLTTTVGPFILVIVLTLVVMTQLLTAFTVPNPLGTEFGSPDNSNIPGVPPAPAGPGVGPGQGDNNSEVTPELKTLIQSAAEMACLPSAYLTAVLQVEAPGSLNYTVAQSQQFDQPDWWTAANNGVNCYSGTNENCKIGYCYNTCAVPGLCAAGAEVRGAAQFEYKTFYGGNCSSYEGKALQCLAAGTPANYIATKVRSDTSYIPNRCRLTDALYASSYKLANDSGAANFSSTYACTYNASRWDPITAKSTICLAARAYCGSCGFIESLPPSGQPCEEFYRKPGESGYASAGCGGRDSLGHCNMVYNNYIQNLN